MGVKLGTFARGKIDMSTATSVANQMLSQGRNTLNHNNLNALSSWESNPVGNLYQGINKNTSIDRQLGVGGISNDWGIK